MDLVVPAPRREVGPRLDARQHQDALEKGGFGFFLRETVFFCYLYEHREPTCPHCSGLGASPKDWHEATNVCAAEGKVLCGVDKPCSRGGCMYDLHYQWTGEACQAGDAGLPAAC